MTKEDPKLRAERTGSNKTPVKVLAERYGVHWGTICRAARGQFWDLGG